MLAAGTFCTVLGLLQPGPTSPAEPPADEERRVVRHVVFGVVGDGWIDSNDLDGALAAGLRDLGVTFALEAWPTRGTIFDQLRRARATMEHAPGTSVIWLVHQDDDRAELYVLPPGSDLGYVRQLQLAAEPTERSEAIAAVTRGVVQALEEGIPRDLRAVTPRAAEPQTAMESSPSPESTRDDEPSSTAEVPPVRVAFALQYVGASLASNAAWQNGPDLELALHARPGVRAMVGGSVTFGKTHHETLPLQIFRLPLQFGMGYVHTFGGRLGLDATAVIQAERLAWSSATGDPQLEGLEGAYWRMGLGPTVGLAVHLGAGISIRLSAGMQGWVIDRALAIELDGNTITVLDPHPVSANATLGLQLEFPPPRNTE